jgi:hypothetical protein
VPSQNTPAQAARLAPAKSANLLRFPMKPDLPQNPGQLWAKAGIHGGPGSRLAPERRK